MAHSVVEVASDVFCAAGTDVNWAILREGSEYTLVDAGYPGDSAVVEASIESLGGRPEDVRAILLTHAHVDHMGAIDRFFHRYGTPLFTSAVETEHARRTYLEQVRRRDIARNLWRAGVLGWSVRAARAGGTKHLAAAHAQPFPSSGALDLPGRPTPVATTGHTSGHVAFFMSRTGVVVTGDALVTGHPTSRVEGPQLLPAMFAHSQAESMAAMANLEGLQADLVIPGHGPVYRGDVAAAVAQARRASSTW